MSSDLVAIERRLRNWAAWVRPSEGGGAGHCGSAEWMFVLNRDSELLRKGQLQVIDTGDAERVDRTLRYMPERRESQFLVAWYHARLPREQLVARFGVESRMVHPFRLQALSTFEGRVVQMHEFERVALIRRSKPSLWAGVDRAWKVRV